MIEAICDGVQQLTKLVAGGNVPEGVIIPLLANPENIEDLLCIVLQDAGAGQANGIRGLIFFPLVEERFTNLRFLHLCKPAKLSEDNEVVQLEYFFQAANDQSTIRE